PRGSLSQRALLTAWRDVLQGPLDGAAQRAREWHDTSVDTSFEAISDGSDELPRLQDAIAIAADVQRLRNERAAAQQAVLRLGQAPPLAIEAASRRVTEVRVLDPDADELMDPACALAVGKQY